LAYGLGAAERRVRSHEVSFLGFDGNAVRQLGELPDWCAEDYAAERSRLTAGLLDPGAALISAIAEELDFDLTVVKRSSVSPLHRDLRFASKGAPRYKDHLLLTTWSGKDKKVSPTLWVRIDSECVGFASGLGFDAHLRERWRNAVGGGRGDGLARAIARLSATEKKRDVEVAGQSLKKVPSPWSTDHPREALLRMNSFQIRFRETLPKAIEKPAFVGWCTKRLERLLPVHDWLVSELGQGLSKR
jgi:hypothetical protein